MTARWRNLALDASLRNELARYIGAGLMSFGLGLGLGLSALFREVLRWPAEIAVAVTLAILLLTNFWLSRRFVFPADGDAGGQLLRFVAAAVAMRASEYVIFYLLLEPLNLHYLAAFTIALVISNGAKFFLYRSLVFRRYAGASAPQ